MRSDADYARLAERAKAEREAERARLDRELAATLARMTQGGKQCATPCVAAQVARKPVYRAYYRQDGTYFLDVDNAGYRRRVSTGLVTVCAWEKCVTSTKEYLASSPSQGGPSPGMYREEADPTIIVNLIASFEAWQAKQGG